MEQASVMDIIGKRRSVRAYLDKPVEDEKLEQIIEAARLAPSTCNLQCWRFVVVRDRATREELVEKAFGGFIVPNRWIGTAAVLIAVCVEPNLVVHRLGGRIQGVDYHVLDAGIATEHVVLRATELGLGTCWIGWFNERWVKKILKVPKRVKVVALLSLGYPNGEPIQPRERLPLRDILFYDKYGARE